MKDKDHGLIKRLVFKLVKKHIAGSTNASIIRVVKQLNEHGVSATVTFLNENAETPAKVRYNINAYAETIRQLSRLNLKAEVSLRLSQLGYLTSKEQAISALDEICAMASKYGTKLWIESENSIIQNNIFDIKDHYGGAPDFGVEVPVDYLYKYSNGSIPKPMLSYKNIKLISLKGTQELENQTKQSGNKDKKSKKNDEQFLCSKYLPKLYENNIETTIFSHNEKSLFRIMDYSKHYKSHLKFEVPLGYNRKRFGMMLKSDQKVSVYAAYGKDWIPYAINKLTDGRIKEIAKAVLDGESGVK